ncbi:MAG: DUF4331 domain-containing protein, partial [Cytophagaceae bacterium]|nr:DUF4331 domain-containing protein [Cytophagaceae bacterium]
FIHNFLPTLGDMLRLNMAVPATPRNDPKFSSLGLVQAAVLGLTDAAYNTTSTLQFIPNMDGFPNGRRLEDDVTTIELQAVSGIVLAAIGLPYDDFVAGGSLATPKLLSVLTFNAGVTKNDTILKAVFPYVQNPWRAFNGNSYSGPDVVTSVEPGLGLAAPEAVLAAAPNPFQGSVRFRYKLAQRGTVLIRIADLTGRTIDEIRPGMKEPGTHTVQWSPGPLPQGICLATMLVDDQKFNTVKLIKQ